MAALAEGLFGYHLVQIQGFGHAFDWLSDSPIPHQIQLDLYADAKHQTSLYACSEILPLATASVDVVVLPHTLDFALDPHRVLREVERVLIPEGYVIILGFNPISLWGLWRSVLKYRGKAPWTGHFLPYQRIIDWLGVLGFDIEASDVCAFAPPMTHASWAARLEWMESRVKPVLPGLSGVYALRAVKRVSRIRPIKMRTQRLRKFRPSTVLADFKNQ